VTKLLHYGGKLKRMSLGTIQPCLSGQGRVANTLLCRKFLLSESVSFTQTDMAVGAVRKLFSREDYRSIWGPEET